MYFQQCHDCIRPILRVLAVLLVFIFVPSPPASYATFPGTNGEIAFTSIRDGVSEVYVMNSDGSGQTNCTINPTEDINPAWSPDGTKIAFASNRDGNFEIYVVNTNCMTGLVRLTTNLAYNRVVPQ